MRFPATILPWVISALTALGIVMMQAIGGGGRPMFPLLVSYLPVLLAGLLCLPLLGMVSGKGWRADPAAMIAALVFGAYLLSRTSFGGDAGLRVFEWLRIAATLLVYLVAATAVTAKGPRLLFVSIIILAGFLQASCEIYQCYRDAAWSPLRGWLPFLQRYYPVTVGTFANKNHLAWLLCDGSLFALCLACWGRFRWALRGIFLYAALVLAFGVCISLSRGGVVALMTGLGVFAAFSVLLLLTSRDRGTLIAGIVAGLLLAAGTALLLGGLASNAAFSRRMNALWMDTYREDLWRAAVHDLGIAPFFGLGAGSFQWSARLMMPFESLLAHNDYAQILSEYGTVGLMLLIVFLVLQFRAALPELLEGHRLSARLSARDREGIRLQGDSRAILLGAVSAVSAQVIHSFCDFNMHLASNALLAGFCLGILCAPSSGDSTDSVSPWSRRLVALCVAGLVGFTGWLLLREWSGERSLFAIEEVAAKPVASLGGKELAEASATASSLLEKNPASARVAAVRANLYRMQCSLGAGGLLHEPYDSVLLQRQLEKTSSLDPGDWYVRLVLSGVMARLGDDEGSQREFLEAMVRLPLYALVYQEHAATLEGFGNPREALRYYRIAFRIQYARELLSKIKELEKTTGSSAR